MLLGYLIVRTLLVLVRVFGRLPDGVSRRYAQLLDAATAPFHVINYWGSCVQTRVFGVVRMGRTLDKDDPGSPAAPPGRH